MREVVVGRHAVMEALRAGRPVTRLVVGDHVDERALRDLLALARDQDVPIGRASADQLEQVAEGARHQGVLAYVEEALPVTLDDVLKLAVTRNEAPFLCLLDGIEDPQNLGAIIRSAEAAGAHGVLLGSRQTATVTPAVVKAAAGATEHLKIARVPSLPNALLDLRRKNVWIGGTDAREGTVYWEAKLGGPLVLVIGSEERGMSALVRERCDFLVRIPMRGKVASLNAAAACAVLLMERHRQTAAGKPPAQR